METAREQASQAAQLEKLRQEYESKIAQMQTQFLRKQIEAEKEHAKDVSRCLLKLEENGNSAR